MTAVEDRPRGRSRTLLSIVVCVVAVAVAVAVVGGAVAIVWSTALDQHGPHQAIPDTPVCRGLTARVGDLDVIEWDNGLTKSGPSWGAALTQGVQHATPASREAIARKVASDSASYSDMVSRLNPAQRADFDWLRGILTHPTRKWNEPDPQRTLAAIETVASLESDCGIMP